MCKILWIFRSFKTVGHDVKFSICDGRYLLDYILIYAWVTFHLNFSVAESSGRHIALARYRSRRMPVGQDSVVADAISTRGSQVHEYYRRSDFVQYNSRHKHCVGAACDIKGTSTHQSDSSVVQFARWTAEVQGCRPCRPRTWPRESRWISICTYRICLTE